MSPSSAYPTATPCGTRAEDVAHVVPAHHAVLDGEICRLEPDGRTHFNKLFFRRDRPSFYAFDVLSIEVRT